MEALGVTAPETWMIGDNLEWEVVAPQRLGIYAIWIDVAWRRPARGLHRQARPHHPLADGTAARRSSMKPLPLQSQDPVPLPTKNIENNPMHSSQAVAGMSDCQRQPFDTSGKSAALIQGAD